MVLSALASPWMEFVAGSSINVGMKAAFPTPPYLLELLETAAGEDANAYFPLLDEIAAGTFRAAKTDQALYEKFVEVLEAKNLVQGREGLSTFKLALALRASAPRIEAHYQYYETAAAPSVSELELGCENWILFDGHGYCTPTFDQAGANVKDESQSRLLPFDRELGSGPAAVLYANPNHADFSSLHQQLVAKARNGELTYRLRYQSQSRDLAEPLPVSGYGVELQLKRTDYIVIDDREAAAVEAEPKEGSTAQVVLDDEEAVSDLKPLSSSEVAFLGHKASSFILNSDAPLTTLVKLTQDFPKFSASIAAHNTSDDFFNEHQDNRGILVPAGMNVLWMNGLQMTDRQIDPYTLIENIRRERKFIKGVTDIGLTGEQAVALLGHHEVSAASGSEESERFDWTDRSEDGRVIIWLNNLEKDSRYAKFPSNIMALLQRSYGGQINPIRKDVFNLVVPVDFSNPDDLTLVVEQLMSFIQRTLPVRFGLVPLTSTKDAEDQAKLAYYLLENYGLAAFMAYLQNSAAEPEISRSKQTANFAKAIDGRKLHEDSEALTMEEVLGSENYNSQIQLAQRWVRRLGADSKTPPVFFNGFAIPRDQAWLQTMSRRLGADMQVVQQGIFMGNINDDMWIPGVFLQGAASRRNPYVLTSSDNPLVVMNINKLYTEHKDMFDGLTVIEEDAGSSQSTLAVLTVLTNLETEEGKKLLLSAAAFRRSNPGVRLEIVPNPSNAVAADSINHALQGQAQEILKATTSDELAAILSRPITAIYNGFDEKLAPFLKAVGVTPGAQVVLLNGRVVGPFNKDAPFTEEDLQQLLEYEQAARISPVYRAVEALGLVDKICDPIAAAKLTSITALSTISDVPEGIFESAPTVRTTMYDKFKSEHTMFEVGDAATASIQLAAVLNPVSEQCQKWASILKVLSELDGVYLRVFLNPRDRLDELPIKRFYRQVFESAPSFDAHGKVAPSVARFTGVPSEALLNLGTNVPPAWLVSAKETVHDPDNLKLASIKGDVDIVYELEHILIEGHSRDNNGSPPRGAQLVLGTKQNPHTADTLIMANIGYFQFKANPGYYNIELKEGRSSEIFEIESVGTQGHAAVPGDEGTEVALMSFEGATLYPRLKIKPGKEEEDVLEESSSTGGDDLLSRGLKFAEGLLGSSKSKSKAVDKVKHAEINIFSVASGHLYERMLNIMMVSVMKNTKHSVKFWFIEQFLSPSFKEFIPHLAAEYGFQYEMVTYKWPHWLRQQKEKQREIWGYKILFLDVLFPLSLDKVIFVDADQVVRTDMIDLVNHDLEGAPYGFTPMCDSRTEMEGFRFWKQGYWANYLRGLPYHISALYVVDLKRFRQLAAGDRLRQQYHTLSADPNSLANLDQDLPNHMQFNIPIHSLPQEWLWCETWCSDESLKEARTIDLCNNPQTKEPKLDRARRQVPEWTVYDDEIAAVDRKRKGLPPVAHSSPVVQKDDAGDGAVHIKPGDVDNSQKVMRGDDKRNTKSRTLQEEPTSSASVKDEL
ncbi:UDP-glucose:glycoprotein glucosyltransferase [Microdochium trichocladiopsis]|uniref:UDP-glucose:glycoprotein glucosyltransferase n=1 Tax=Microdochium trichocladiopsis TaxID=1682393 RepID=A0A9P8XU60_9PEZI|nr:UDP-glucose:glycoprotein glucosyltransferase [Microdochium trichocladiopsis]KAH7018189.1 UDP-glucose:glycoprotein glucosyltransferase [Microdochium trichocladiopsis]